MRFIALATDYDGTLAHDGCVSDRAILALRRLRQNGRPLVLVTGRVLPELVEVFPEASLFDWIVAENGALLYQPSSGTTRLLSERPAEAFVACLQKQGVTPLSVGQSIVATRLPCTRRGVARWPKRGIDAASRT